MLPANSLPRSDAAAPGCERSGCSGYKGTRTAAGTGTSGGKVCNGRAAHKSNRVLGHEPAWSGGRGQRSNGANKGGIVEEYSQARPNRFGGCTARPKVRETESW